MHKKRVQIKETPYGYTFMHKKHVQIKERRQDLWKHVCTRFRHRRTGRFFFG